MAVIGRLDEQVDALLIKPLDKKHTPEQTTTDEQADGEKPERAGQGTHPRQEQQAKQADAHEEEKNASSQNERDASAQLPVWLL